MVVKKMRQFVVHHSHTFWCYEGHESKKISVVTGVPILRRKKKKRRSSVLVLEWLIGQGSWSWYSSTGISIRRIGVGFPLKK